MLLAATVRRDGEAIVALPEADDLVLWDTATGEEQRLPNPAGDLAAGRRLAVVEALLAQGAGAVCAVPLGFCTVSHALARAADLRFLPVEAGTPLRLLRAHAAGLLAAALPELPVSWLARPATPPADPEAADAFPLPDAAARAVLNRLKRLEGQARGVQRLIEGREDYEQILVQVAAMRAAINAVGVTLLAENLAACLAAAGEDGDTVAAVEAAKRAFRHLD
jgi:CsoR family transcriptional regulator, copper-sensing transcriptional repressor